MGEHRDILNNQLILDPFSLTMIRSVMPRRSRLNAPDILYHTIYQGKRTQTQSGVDLDAVLQTESTS
jgi:hypothetical protein